MKRGNQSQILFHFEARACIATKRRRWKLTRLTLTNCVLQAAKGRHAVLQEAGEVRRGDGGVVESVVHELGTLTVSNKCSYMIIRRRANCVLHCTLVNIIQTNLMTVRCSSEKYSRGRSG